jgi:ABC-type multidrug transport system permease subunit
MLSFLLPQLLESVVETMLFGNIVYWACNFTREAGPYFTFLLVIWTSSNALGALFRLLAFSLPNLVVAQAFGGKRLQQRAHLR